MAGAGAAWVDPHAEREKDIVYQLSAACNSEYAFYRLRELIATLGDVTLTADQSLKLSTELFMTAGNRNDPGFLILLPAILEEIGFTLSTPSSTTPFVQAFLAMSETRSVNIATVTIAAGWINVLHTLLALTPDRSAHVRALAEAIATAPRGLGFSKLLTKHPFAIALGYDTHEEISSILSDALCMGLEFMAKKGPQVPMERQRCWLEVLSTLLCFPRPDERPAFVKRYVHPVLRTLVRTNVYSAADLRVKVLQSILNLGRDAQPAATADLFKLLDGVNFEGGAKSRRVRR
jgi:hypothetical protein